MGAHLTNHGRMETITYQSRFGFLEQYLRMLCHAKQRSDRNSGNPRITLISRCTNDAVLTERISTASLIS
jgi:hypothetical protein